MKFLCLAYGDEEGWKKLDKNEQQEVLANDKVIRDRGNLMSAVRNSCTTVTNWNQNLKVTTEPFVNKKLPLAGFSVIEVESVEEAIKLVSNTPCARASGAIEIRPLWAVKSSDE